MKPPKNFYSNLDRRKQGLPELPEASAADAGKVIKVGSGGDYELASDAGSIVMIVTLANDFTANKTYNEILAALNNGDIVKLVDWTGRNYIYSGMTSGRICFAYLNGYSNTNESDVFTAAVDDTNVWELFLDTITHLPDYSPSDNGKFLGVDSNGDLEFANVPNELPAVTSADSGKVLTVDSSGEWEVRNIPKVAKRILIDFIDFTQIIPNISDVVDDIDNGVVVEFINTSGVVFQYDRKDTNYLYVYNIHPTSSNVLSIMAISFKLTDGTADSTVIKSI